MDQESFRDSVRIDLLATDGVAGLKSLHSLLRHFLSFYFIAITLLILSYLSPSTLVSYEMILVILLFIIGLVLILIGFRTLDNIIGRKKQEIMEEFNKKINELNRELFNFRFSEMTPERKKEFENLTLLLEAYHAERERMLSIVKKNQVINKMALLQPGIPVMLSFIAFVLDLYKKLG